LLCLEDSETGGKSLSVANEIVLLLVGSYLKLSVTILV